VDRRRAVVIGLVLAAAAARGDNVDDLGRALTTDPSFRVKVQAAVLLGKLKNPRARGPLLAALRDENEAVRAVAASALGQLGDRAALPALRAAQEDPSPEVRGAAGKAVALLQKLPARPAAGAPTVPGGKVFVALSPMATGKGGPDNARRVHDHVAAALGELAGVTLAPGEATRARFYLDGNITNLATTAPDGSGHVRTDCDLRVVMATYPERAIKMMATVGGSVDGTSDPKDIASARIFCLDDAAQQVVAKVQTFLATQP
jgi:HEAT repeat protein